MVVKVHVVVVVVVASLSFFVVCKSHNKKQTTGGQTAPRDNSTKKEIEQARAHLTHVVVGFVGWVSSSK